MSLINRFFAIVVVATTLAAISIDGGSSSPIQKNTRTMKRRVAIINSNICLFTVNRICLRARYCHMRRPLTKNRVREIVHENIPGRKTDINI